MTSAASVDDGTYRKRFNTMEAILAEQSSIHGYLNWAKERVDEMDAALASLETKAGQIKAEAKPKSDELIAELKRRRDEFQALVKKQADAGQAAWEEARKQSEAQWSGFEARVRTYFDTVGKQIEQQQATFRDVAAAQLKAWHDIADKFNGEATKVAVARRADIDAAIKQMKADASVAEARLQQVKQAGSESWATMSAALAESRKAFDRANQAAWDALKRAAPPQA